MQQNKKISDYAVVLVNEFAKKKNISTKEAYIYLLNFKGIEFIKEFYDVEHTLSFEDAIEDITRICQNNGGAIK